MAGLSAAALFNLFSTGQYLDFTVTCKDHEFKVHKTVICPESHFFQSVCKGNFQVTAMDLKSQSFTKVAVQTVGALASLLIAFLDGLGDN